MSSKCSRMRKCYRSLTHKELKKNGCADCAYVTGRYYCKLEKCPFENENYLEEKHSYSIFNGVRYHVRPPYRFK
jgi:hypothetical protein